MTSPARLVSEEPDSEAMNLRVLAALHKREAGEKLSEREQRIIAYYDGGQCASCVTGNSYLRR